MQCPQCQSANIQKLSMVYATGTHLSTSVSRSRSRGISSRMTVMIGSSSSRHQGIFQTALAEAASPPQPSRLPKIAAVLLVVYTVFPAFFMFTSPQEEISIWVRIFAFIIFVAFSVGTYFVYKFLNRGYEERLADWERAWICMRCGLIYDPYDYDDTEL